MFQKKYVRQRDFQKNILWKIFSKKIFCQKYLHKNIPPTILLKKILLQNCCPWHISYFSIYITGLLGDRWTHFLPQQWQHGAAGPWSLLLDQLCTSALTQEQSQGNNTRQQDCGNRCCKYFRCCCLLPSPWQGVWGTWTGTATPTTSTMTSWSLTRRSWSGIKLDQCQLQDMITLLQ